MARRGKYEAKRVWPGFFRKQTPQTIGAPEAAEPEIVLPTPEPETDLPVQILEEEPEVLQQAAGEPKKWKHPPLLSPVVTVLSVGMLLICAASLYFLSWNYWDLFGVQAFLVPAYGQEDLAVIRETDPYTLKEGDTIAFLSEDPEDWGATRLRRIRRVEMGEDGLWTFYTYDAETRMDDLCPVSEAGLLGRCLFRISNMGAFFSFLQTVPGYLCCAFLPFFLLVLIYGGRILRELLNYRRQRRLRDADAKQAVIEQQQQMIAAMQEEMRQLRAGQQKDPPQEY